MSNNLEKLLHKKRGYYPSGTQQVLHNKLPMTIFYLPQDGNFRKDPGMGYGDCRKGEEP